METLARLCGATIPESVRDAIASMGEGDREALSTSGIEFATAQCAELLEAGVPGLHIYTMDRSKSAVGVVSQLRDKGLLLSAWSTGLV